MNSAAIWDMDGVLVDSGPLHLLAWQEMARQLGREFTEEDFRRTFGMRSQEIIQTLLGPMPPEEVDHLVDLKERGYRCLAPGRLAPKPGTVRLLSELSQAGFRQAVASSAPRENVEQTLDLLGIGGYFQAVITGVDVRRSKPDPEVFLLAALALGVLPARCVVLEDALVGVRAARGAGMRCVAVAGTYPLEALKEADLAVNSLEELDAQRVAELLG